MKTRELQRLARKLKTLKLDRPVHIMEVCGTHTTQFFHTGVRDLFPERLNLVDGPGCPVCVTPNAYLDRAIEIARRYRVILSTFGDMMRVPSSTGSLQREKAAGRQVEIVYSPLDALALARDNPGKEVVFLSVGFETTLPTEAVAVEKARRENIRNFFLLTGNKLTPPAVRALLDAAEVHIDGFILPGHVSVVTGVKGWRFVVEKYRKPCIIAGFEARNLLTGTLALVTLIRDGKAEIINGYREVVSENGNQKAWAVVEKVFECAEARWRGIGAIPQSGMRLRESFRDFDAETKFPVSLPEEIESPGCCCGQVLRGLITPPQCPLFGSACSPDTPVGACMVSSEGSCAAYFKYGGFKHGR